MKSALNTMTFEQGVIIIVFIIGFLVLLAITIYTYYKEIDRYNKTAYHRQTKTSWEKVHSDKGKKGEYEIYRYLQKFEEYGAVYLFNSYIPKLGGKTTEIDIIMIFKKGIVVLESKNYGGWIFGDEKSLNWMQTFPNGEKYPFYNPILQNKGHIEHLKNILNRDIPIFSLIVFSERCTLKKVPENTNHTKIIKRCNITGAVQRICEDNPDVIDSKEVHDIYRDLFYYTQVDEQTKQEHIKSIRK